MYCNAALLYQPIIACIGMAGKKTKDEKAKEACNLAIAEALGSSDPEVNAKRDRTCGE